MNNRPLILGTRGSALALAQTNHIRARLHRAFPRLELEVRIIKTTGDRKLTAALARSGAKGLFTKELEQALLRNKIDMAIHSLKDLPTDLPAGLELGAVAEREDARDVLISTDKLSLEAPRRVFTSSPRRALQARLLWPACETREIRGNVGTRLEKLAKGGEGDALLMAAAGLKRLDYLQGDSMAGTLRFDPPLEYRRLSLEEMLPAPGQAAIGIEIRAGDGETRERLRAVNHPPTWFAVAAERAFLRGMGGGCAAPMAACGAPGTETIRVTAISMLAEGKVWRGECSGPLREAEAMGRRLAEQCREHGKA